MGFLSFIPPISYPSSLGPPVIRIPDLDINIGDLSNKFKDLSKDSALTLAKFLVDVNVKTDLKEQLEPLIQEAFTKLESFLNDVASAADNLLGKSKKMLEDLLSQALDGLSKLLEDIEKKVSNILTQAKTLAEDIINKFRTDILDVLFDRVDSLREKLVDDIRQLIGEAKQAGEDLLYKADTIATGTIANLKDDIDKLASDLEEKLDIAKWFDLNVQRARKQEEEREDLCKKQIFAIGQNFSTLGSAQFYEYRQCITQRRLNDAIKLSEGKLTIRNIKLVYADLNDRAWKLACIGRAEGAKLQSIALADWLRFGQIFQLWNQFEDDMELLNAINQTMDKLQNNIDTTLARSKELDEKIEVFQTKLDQIDDLDLEVKNVKDSATSAIGSANSAQATANQAIADTASLRSDVQNGSVVAQKALMLQARDSNHWMRFHKVDASNHDLFELWRTDNTWHPTIRVQASDKLLARNDSHWMRHKGVDKNNHDCYGLWVIPGNWHNLIQVGATGPLP
ncbi:MAG: hypothetical protein WA902_21445 [Thermosynechococcaceae cyanobacterium]